MPDKALVFTALGIVLQYSLLMLIYYFLFKVIKIIIEDLRVTRQSVVEQKKNHLEPYFQGKLLVVEDGSIKLAQRSFILGETISIGRNGHNGIVIDDAFVSYEHATINKNKQGYWLTDLKSTNKTYLNGQVVAKSILLAKGDLIKIGAVTFSFEG